MTSLNRPHNHASGPNEAAADEQRRTRRLSPQLIFDAVVAGYIRDISDRRRPSSGGRDRLVRAQRLALS